MHFQLTVYEIKEGLVILFYRVLSESSKNREQLELTGLNQLFLHITEELCKNSV
jgi:hypothetical protein